MTSNTFQFLLRVSISLFHGLNNPLVLHLFAHLRIHMDSLVITVASLLLLVFAWRFLYKTRASGNDKQRRFHPIVGTMLHQAWNFRRLHDYHTDLSHKYKTFRLLGPFPNRICTVDPANVEYILRTNFGGYGKGWLNYEFMRDLLGDGIFTVDGEKWRHQRKLASHDFSTRVLRDFSSIVFKNKATKLAQIISDASRSDRQMEIQDLLMRSTMDSIFKIGFGAELNTLDGSNKEGTTFAKAFDDSSVSITKRFTDLFWKLKRFFNIGSEADLKKNIKVIDNFVYKLIHSRMESTSGQKSDLVKREDMLSRFLLEREKDPETMSLQYLRDIILNFLIAGRDTTAGTLAWFFYMICKHPSIQEKIAREIKEAVQAGEKMSFDEFAMNLNEEALDKMQYLHAALSETLRLYPAVPMDSKVCFADDTLPDGFHVRKGNIVTYLPYPMGRMPFLWGNDPEIFRPERWFDENGVFQHESPFKFTAFQAGPRICLGREFAYRQMKIFAAVLLHFFKFKLSDENKIVNYKTMITLQIEDGLVVQAQHKGFM